MNFLEQAKEYLPQIIENFLDWACNTNYVINKDISPESYMMESPSSNLFILTQIPGIDLSPALDKIAERLPRMDIARGSIAGFFIGTVGENGISTKLNTIALLDHFIKCVDLCISFLSLQNQDIENIFRNHINEYKASAEMPLLCTAVMSRITTDREYRDYLRQKEGLTAKINSIAKCYGNSQYIPDVLRMPEKETVIFLHLELNKGCEVEIECIDNNFQLFSYFQMELYHQGLLNEYGVTDFKYNQAIDQVIHRNLDKGMNYVAVSRTLFDVGVFGYYQYPARYVNSDGEAKYSVMNLVFGEENIYGIQKLENTFIILLTKNAALVEDKGIRSWNGAYIGGVHSNLVPKLKITKQLTPEEIEKWKLKIDHK